MSALVWLRRDLRRTDLPTLGAAHEAAAGRPVTVAVVIDPQFFDNAGAARQAWFAATVTALQRSYDGRLCVRAGDPVRVIPELASEIGAASVHVSTETEPEGAARDRAVRRVLEAQGVAWIETGSPYAVTPGRVRTRSGEGFQVFTPFSKAWLAHGWRPPAAEPAGLELAGVPDDGEAWARLTVALEQPGVPELPAAGEDAALARWRSFLDDGLASYSAERDRADLDATSGMSPYLALGVVHPRTLLADLEARGGESADRLRTELGWREFYGDVLVHHPDSLWHDLRPGLEGLSDWDDTELVEAWRQGRTGHPFVDAGMRQLLATGWMHNRVRMVVASFLTKDLHTHWTLGARWFLGHLIDGDLASNNHGWQWVAGTGSDAAPYFRVFNPVLQGRRFDPAGDYVRRWVPELAHVPGAAVHEPWDAPGAYDRGYPRPILDHGEERRVSLARYGALTRG